MKYTINLIVVFDPEHRTLALNNNNQTAIELSRPSCRVLNEFIKSNGVNLSRDSLLKNAWEDYGFPPSNASLNNCISELRKSFVSLGIENPTIITLPRVGFRMEADIHPTPKHKPDVSVKNVADEVEQAQEMPTLKEERSAATLAQAMPGKSIKKPMVLYLLALISGLTIAGLILLLWTPADPPKPVGSYKQCDIYSIRKEPLPNSERKATKMLESEKIDCEHARHDVFYTEERPDNDLMKITFMAACKKNQTGSDYQYCKTFKIVE